jgi:hypothetical protein
MAVNRKSKFAPKENANEENETRRDTMHSPKNQSKYGWKQARLYAVPAANRLSRMRGGETATAQRMLEAGSRLVKSGVHAAFRLATGNGFVKAIHLCRAGRAGSLAAQCGADIDSVVEIREPLL